MVKKKISKTEAKEKISQFFLNIKDKSPKEINKIKRLSMNQRISLKGHKQLFCPKCLKPYVKAKIRIKSGFKTITCENCGGIGRWKI